MCRVCSRKLLYYRQHWKLKVKIPDISDPRRRKRKRTKKRATKIRKKKRDKKKFEHRKGIKQEIVILNTKRRRKLRTRAKKKSESER